MGHFYYLPVKAADHGFFVSRPENLVIVAVALA